jgi:hypothetical protein
MNRRLYFLFPDVAHAQRAVGELKDLGIDPAQLHALARPDRPLDPLPAATPAQRQDRAARLERLAWTGNLVLFGVALAAFVALGLAGQWALAGLAAFIMLASFYAGYRFTRLPNVHLQEFREALRHGEVLLMVDVPLARVPEVEERIHRDHPEAAAGGASWQWDGLAA